MGFQNSLKKICNSLGTNNKPTYVVMAIAAVKGIARPAFTMMDKTESPETKKYTALREGLTEAIAIPAYFICGEASAKLANAIYKDKHPTAELSAMSKRAQKNLMFVGVCTAALFIIPALCSVAIKPIMDAMHLKSPNKPKTPQPKPVEQPVKSVTPNPVVNPNNNQSNTRFAQMSSFRSRPQIGLRVGL